ncbi:hypothetical protein NAU58_13475 [Pseudomonas stutzeri]|uniref:hypothetical protein n=1 Tax=Stutzerimonas stutzeri TaxID=316 RepID=UPI0011AEFAEB|nr:hypothetical protein [Stutzerimonas stutzeri]MCQ4296591.1 hypothetical protein [Stutzerimonas stutzeri]
MEYSNYRKESAASVRRRRTYPCSRPLQEQLDTVYHLSESPAAAGFAIFFRAHFPAFRMLMQINEKHPNTSFFWPGYDTATKVR